MNKPHMMITDVKVYNNPTGVMRWVTSNMIEHYSADGPLTKITEEEVYSYRFTNANGETVYIGATEAVQKAIGLPFTIFEKQTQEIRKQRESLDAWLNLSVSEHLKIAFDKFLQRFFKLKVGG